MMMVAGLALCHTPRLLLLLLLILSMSSLYFVVSSSLVGCAAAKAS
jgi:hypothetical protein